jgi:hypothetical protein
VGMETPFELDATLGRNEEVVLELSIRKLV